MQRPCHTPGMAKNTEKKKSRRRGGGRMGLMELAAPAAAVLVGPKALVSVQDVKDKTSAEKDKVPFALAAGAWWMSGNAKYKKYAPAVMVLAAVAFRRRKALLGELGTDTKELIIAEDTPTPAK